MTDIRDRIDALDHRQRTRCLTVALTYRGYRAAPGAEGTSRILSACSIRDIDPECLVAAIETGEADVPRSIAASVAAVQRRMAAKAARMPHSEILGRLEAFDAVSRQLIDDLNERHAAAA